MKKCTLILLFILINLSSALSDDIYTLIKKGELKKAADSLSLVTTASKRNGDILFFQSLIEEDAKQSIQLLEASLKASVSVQYRQEIYLKLAQYYYLTSNNNRLRKILLDYRTKWENGKYRRQMLRFSILVDEKEKSYDKAIRTTDRYLMENNSGSEKQWGMIDKARVMNSFNKKIAARKLLRNLSKEKSKNSVAQALYLLASDAITRNRPDDAVFYYNLMRESYPDAVGLDAIIDKMSSLSVSSDIDSRAEKITGTFYSIQVGVFSKKSNAKKQANLFKHFDKKIDIKNKSISNVKYHVVYVGRFTTYESALKFKKRLELEHNEVFQVVAR